MNDYLDDIIMPFGKYKGEYVCDLPLKYLEWLTDNCELRGELEKSVKQALNDAYDNL